MCNLYESIKSLCDEHGITGAKMCSDIGISRNLLTELKAGRRSGISADKARKIAEYFGVSVERVLGGNEQTYAEQLYEKHNMLMHRVGRIEDKMSDADKKALEGVIGMLEDKYAD